MLQAIRRLGAGRIAVAGVTACLLAPLLVPAVWIGFFLLPLALLYPLSTIP